MSEETRILVVDHDPARLQSLSTLLRAQGYAVLEAATAQEALPLIREQQPGVVLLDAALPDTSGVVLCGQIKADKSLSSVIVALVSGDAGTQSVENLAGGADDVLARALSPAEMLGRVRTLLKLHRAMAALRASERQYQHLLDVLPDAFGVVDAGGRLVAVNPQAATMLGYEQAEELLRKSVFDLTPAEDHQEIKAELQRAFETGVLRKIEYFLLRRNKARLVVEISGTVVRQRDGQPQQLVCLVRDITERKQVERALRDSVQQFRQFTSCIREVFWMTDPSKTEMVYISPGYEEIWGRSCQSLYAAPRNWLEAIHPDDRERVLQAALTRQVSGDYDEVYRIVRPDGSWRWIHDRAFPVRDAAGQVYRIVGVAADITRQKRAEEELQLLADAVQSAHELICITDAENRFTFANRAFLAAYGYPLAEILGRTPEFLTSTNNPPGLGARVYQETLQGGWQGELLDRKKDGTEFPIILSTAPIRNAEGRILGLVGVARDITEQKRMERQRAAFAFLAERLGAANDATTAADLILEVASQLFGWDAAYVHLYSSSTDEIVPVLTWDTINGKRSVVSPSTFTVDPSPLMRLVMTKGARLINREEGDAAEVTPQPFGETSRRSACLMHVPIRSGSEVVGILSIQSYTPRAYSPADLQLLLTLADHCGDALHRINMTGALREAEAKYRSIVENAVEGIFQSTPEGRYLSVNPAMARILGYATPEEVVTQVTDIARQVFVRPERREEFKRAVEGYGAVEEFESEHRRKDGSRFWMSVNARVVRDPKGNVLFYEGTALDISERKWAEQLRQLQRDFGIFLGSTSELKAATDRLLSVVLQQDGIDCGAVCLVDTRTNGLELVAHEGLSTDFAWPARTPGAEPGPGPAARPEISMSALVARFAQEGLLAREIVPLQHKGAVVAVLGVGSRTVLEIPVRSLHALDTIAAMAGGAIARIHAEHSLQVQQHLLEQTLRSLSDAVLIVDAEAATILACNPAATRIFGFLGDELVGHSPVVLHRNASAREEFWNVLLAAVKDKGHLSSFEFAMKRQDGSEFPAEHHVVPIMDAHGRVLNWVGVVRDLTEAKRTEAELRSVSRRIIEAQEAERQRVARELHDGVNQIIASAKLRLRSVEDNVGGQNPAARLILSRCGRLLVQALEENRRIAHDLRPTDLDQLGLVAACRSFCKEFHARTGLPVKCQIGRQIQRLPPAVELNLFRIVQEALTNIEKHARARSASLRLSLADGKLLLRIRDDGRGFDPAHSPGKKGKWIGIGLTNMRERAAHLGGTCEVKSAPKRGTTITVSLPFKDDP